MQSAVIVLLKLLLATVTANTNIPVAGDGEQGAMAFALDGELC